MKEAALAARQIIFDQHKDDLACLYVPELIRVLTEDLSENKERDLISLTGEK